MRSRKASELRKVLRQFLPSFLIVGFFSFFVNFLMITPSFYMLEVYDRVISSRSVVTLVMLTAIAIVLMATCGALEWVRSRIMVRISTRFDLTLSKRVFNASFKQALYTQGAKNSSLPMSDLIGLRQFLTGSGLFAFFDAPWIPIYIGVMFFFHPLIGTLTVVGALVSVILAIANERLTGKMLGSANMENGLSVNQFGANLRNCEVVFSMGMLPSLFKRWAVRNYKVLSLQSRASELGGEFLAFLGHGGFYFNHS